MSPEAIAKSWHNKFHFIKENGDTPGLRGPQIGALHALLAHQEEGENERSIVVMPTGTGKTETMLSFLVANQCTRILVVVPSDALRTQTYDKFRTLGKLKELKVVDDNIRLPLVTMVDKTLSDDEWKKTIKDNNVLVTTMAMARGISNVTQAELHKRIDYLIIDEAHHSEAQTWTDFIDGFDESKVLMFTATPFRNDGKRLKGSVIFNYPLRKAKEEGYFSDISFIKVYAYSQEDSDKVIAEKAVAQLKADRANGFDHILMARCNSIDRAKEVFKLYEQYSDLHPVLVYNGITNGKKILNEIKHLEHQIIVCVNMLGEGFDLPQLKVAALHDARQSLAITLQFIGRFARTSSHGNIGKASFVANIEDDVMSDEIAQLYQEDADWNILLPRIADQASGKVKSLGHLSEGFEGDLLNKLDIRDITPASSTLIYKVKSTTTNFKNWAAGTNILKKYEVVYTAFSADIFIAVMKGNSQVDWSPVKDFYDSSWKILVVYFNARDKIAYYNSTTGINPDYIIENIFGSGFQKMEGEQVFKILKYVDRLVLYNFGAKVPSNRNNSFRSFSGSSVAEGIKDLEQSSLAKNNFFGCGYHDGERSSIGCSFKGRIWSRLRLNVNDFKEWCNTVSKFIFDPNVSAEDIFSRMMVRKVVHGLPKGLMPLAVDWNEEVYERNCFFVVTGTKNIYLENVDLSLDYENCNDNKLSFALSFNGTSHTLSLTLDKNGVSYQSDDVIRISDGREDIDVADFLKEYPVSVLYSDESELQGSFYTMSQERCNILIDDNDIFPVNWDGIDLSSESMKKTSKENSIQYYFWQYINDKYEIIFNDDGPGEIADLIGINNHGHEIEVHLYHLKFAHSTGGDNNKKYVTNQINNIYEVCGQAAKSVKWKHLSDNSNFFKKLLKRNAVWKKENPSYSRILKGSEQDLQRLEPIAKHKKRLHFDISIVQPGISKKSMTDDIKQVLGATAHYIQTVANANFTVYCSE